MGRDGIAANIAKLFARIAGGSRTLIGHRAHSFTMPVPVRPKIYHIVHVDRLSSIIADGLLWSDAALEALKRPGTVIGMSAIKARRLKELQLSSHPGLFVGPCVPFYFCPRSIMLYLIHRANHEDLSYRGG